MIHVMVADPSTRGIECARCGKPVSERGEQETTDPAYAVVTVYPKRKAAVFAHYTCSWSMLFEKIAAIHLG